MTMLQNAIDHRTPTGYLYVRAQQPPGKPFNPYPFNLPPLPELGGGWFIVDEASPLALGAFPLQQVFPSYVGTGVVTKAICEAGKSMRCEFEVVSPVFGDPSIQ